MRQSKWTRLGKSEDESALRVGVKFRSGISRENKAPTNICTAVKSSKHQGRNTSAVPASTLGGWFPKRTICTAHRESNNQSRQYDLRRRRQDVHPGLLEL